MISHGAGGATSVAAGRVSYTFGLKGPCVSIDTACSSSLVGMHYGARDVTDNTCDQAVAAGVNLTLNPGKTAAFTITGAEPRRLSCHYRRQGATESLMPNIRTRYKRLQASFLAGVYAKVQAETIARGRQQLLTINAWQRRHAGSRWAVQSPGRGGRRLRAVRELHRHGACSRRRRRPALPRNPARVGGGPGVRFAHIYQSSVQ